MCARGWFRGSVRRRRPRGEPQAAARRIPRRSCEAAAALENTAPPRLASLQGMRDARRAKGATGGRGCPVGQPRRRWRRWLRGCMRWGGGGGGGGRHGTGTAIIGCSDGPGGRVPDGHPPPLARECRRRGVQGSGAGGRGRPRPPPTAYKSPSARHRDRAPGLAGRSPPRSGLAAARVLHSLSMFEGGGGRGERRRGPACLAR